MILVDISIYFYDSALTARGYDEMYDYTYPFHGTYRTEATTELLPSLPDLP